MATCDFPTQKVSPVFLANTKKCVMWLTWRKHGGVVIYKPMPICLEGTIEGGAFASKLQHESQSKQSSLYSLGSNEIMWLEEYL
jgi:hypothetical protein